MRSFVTVVAATILAVAFSGCVQPQNQGNAVTWGVKAATGRLGETTATEWQAVIEVINQRTPEADISLTDEEAQAVVDFIVANDLDSIQEVVTRVEAIQADPTQVDEIVIPESVERIFLEFGIQLDELAGESSSG